MAKTYRKKKREQKLPMCKCGKHYTFRPCPFRNYPMSYKEKIIREKYPELFEEADE